MSRAIHLAMGILATLLISLPSRAQDSPDRQASAPTTSSDPMSVKIPDDALAAHGFAFDDHQRDMCEINGPEGRCRVEAFVFGEKTQDPERFTCSKLDRATYVGHCVDGELQGFAVVIADGTTKQSKEAFISYFSEGRIAYPALTSYLHDEKNFGVREKFSSYGCVYFGKWDDSAKRCGRFIEIYGADLFTEANAQALRDGTFDLSHYAAKFVEFMQRK